MKNLPKIIQGGMGVAISDWKLAKAVSGLGQLGVVSGTGLGNILIARLMDGDLEGHVRRALSHFPFQESVQKIIEQYYVPGGKAPDQSYKRPPMWVIRPPKFLNELTVVANFVEVFLAKEDHGNPVGINLLEKVQMPNISSLYGAMLAGVNFVIIGAGIPTQIPGILDSLAEHQAVSYRLEVVGQKSEEETRIHFDPEAVFPGISEKMGQLPRPWFLPIISSVVLGQALLKRATGKIDGFVVELPTAGGHNAPPRGAMKLDEQGEPIYGKKDDVNLEKIKKLGLPFWLAGSYGSPEKYREALDAGAAGIQVGTLFAYCNESGMEKKAKQALLNKALQGKATVRTSPVASPTGFPFKVVALEGTLSEKDVYESRPRICDMGFLRHIYRQSNGRLGYRCPAEPVEHYVKKEGDADDTINRTCLCNNLFASAGYPQYHDYGYVEPPIITSGDEFVNINRFINPEKLNYSAKDVIKHLTGEN
jgi:nitronate monooxygenase